MERALAKRSPAEAFDHVDTWIFDLDNTLYSPTCKLFDQIDVRMGSFISDLLTVDAVEAKRIQKDYFRSHGTTLNGLIEFHGIDPHDFLDFVHDIDLDVVPRDPHLDAALEKLPGRKVIHTNASTGHAERVMDRLGVRDHFEIVFGIEDSRFQPKPRPEGYHQLLNDHQIDPKTSVMVEDSARNLPPARALGMVTVWLPTHETWSHEGADHNSIDHVTDDLVAWLNSLSNE